MVFWVSKRVILDVIGGANRGHLPLEKVTYASVGPPCVSVIRVSLRLDLPGLRRDLLGRATLRV